MENEKAQKNRIKEFRGLTTLKGAPKKHRMIAFDTETYKGNKEFLCGSAACGDKVFYFDTKKQFYDLVFNPNNHRDMFSISGAKIFATNLRFDFFVMFDKFLSFKDFEIIEKSSGLIMCVSYIDRINKRFMHPTKYRVLANECRDSGTTEDMNRLKSYKKIQFCDTLNIIKSSLEELGKIINIPKLPKPAFLGKLPGNDEEYQIMKSYNMNDSMVTVKFMDWFQDVTVNLLGATLKPTIASTALDLFRRKYLDQWIPQSSKECIEMEYKGYYGGRTEAFKRGHFCPEHGYPKIFTYDVSSLYPAMMHAHEYPKPPGQLKNQIEIDDINAFEGVCYCEFYCPDHIFPLLPVKCDKLLFPTGLIKGYYDFFSIRKAISIGYRLNKIGDGVIYRNRFRPFKKYVEDLYTQRMKWKSEGNQCHEVAKIFLNSLYGKFATRFDNKEMLVHKDYISDMEINNNSTIKPYIYHNDLMVVTTTRESRIPKYVFPIWSLYVTAYGRWRMYELMKNIGFSNVIYTDTDSVKTHRFIETTGKLGDFKLEATHKETVIVKPKFYSYINDDGHEKVRIKGAREFMYDMEKQARIRLLKHSDLIRSITENHKLHTENPNLRALRSAFMHDSFVNEEMIIKKDFELQDNKRDWDIDHITLKPQSSRPLILSEKDYRQQT